MRKEMPYDLCILNIKGNLFIHNKSTWSVRNLDIQYEIDGKKGVVILDGKSNTAIVKGVETSKSLRLRISRKDIIGKLLYKPFVREGQVPRPKDGYIVFIGASIGLDWKLEELNLRQPSIRNIGILYWPEYKFNKKRVIDHILKIPVKPRMVLLKQCAAYFPTDEERAVKEVMTWFALLEKQGITPIAVATVPVTRDHDKEHKGRANSIHKYNNLLRQSGLIFFDLVHILSDKASNGKYLDGKFAKEDGLHLNENAYRVLDQALADFLEDCYGSVISKENSW